MISRCQFSHRIFHPKLIKNGSQNWSKTVKSGEPFGDLFATLSFMLILYWIWITSGSLLAPFDSLLVPFGSLLAPFGALLGHFWHLLAHFWWPWAHFCSPWGSIFSLLGPPGVLSYICWYFWWKYYVKPYFLKIATQNQIVGQPNRDIPKNDARIIV